MACVAKLGPASDVLENQCRHRLDRAARSSSAEDEWDQACLDSQREEFFLPDPPRSRAAGDGEAGRRRDRQRELDIASIRTPKGVSYIAYNSSKGAVNALTLYGFGSPRSTPDRWHPLQRHPARPDAHGR